MAKRLCQIQDFSILSFNAIGTEGQDMDRGIVRLPVDFMKDDLKRSDLVEISVPGKKRKIVRLVRRGAGENGLDNNQMALQYDDLVELGLRGKDHAQLRVRKISGWRAIVTFFQTHPSPLARMEAKLAYLTLVLGVLIGIPVGYVINIIS
jgi:hypothetical protein